MSPYRSASDPEADDELVFRFQDQLRAELLQAGERWKTARALFIKRAATACLFSFMLAAGVAAVVATPKDRREGGSVEALITVAAIVAWSVRGAVLAHRELRTAENDVWIAVGRRSLVKGIAWGAWDRAVQHALAETLREDGAR